MAAGIVASADNFDALFTAHYASLSRVLYRVLGDTGAAEELAAEAFWRLYRSPPRSRENLEGWLYRTGLRLALDTLKKRRRRTHYEALAPRPGGSPNPEEAAYRLEQQERVRAVLAALKPEQTALLVLRAEGYSLAEMASVLSLHSNSIGTWLGRADVAFRKEYVNRYGER